MAEKQEPETEKKIIDAAGEIFTRRGFHGTRMQDIADEAGINKALLHYYYRSKDKLFEEIFKHVVGEVINRIIEILDKELPFEEKIRIFIDTYISILQKHPKFPALVIHEVSHNPERVQQIFTDKFRHIPPKFFNQINSEIEAGRIKAINPAQFMLNITSLCIFPFLAKPLAQFITGFDDKEFEGLIEERKLILHDLIFNGCRAK
jgi:AcrR family transcriptional regulator